MHGSNSVHVAIPTVQRELPINGTILMVSITIKKLTAAPLGPVGPSGPRCPYSYVYIDTGR